jgi:hypothetical protein
MKPIWLLALALLLLTACGPQRALPQTPASAGSPFPPRPVTLPLAGLDPCSLLSSAAQRELGVQTATDGFAGNPTCQWSSLGTPVSRWQFELDTGYGAAAGLAMDSASLTKVDGYGAVETEGLDHGTSCLLWIDTGPGQNLNVLYSNSDGTRRDMNHELACQLSGHAAELVIEGLAALINHPVTASRVPLVGAPARRPAPPTDAPAAPFPRRPAVLDLAGIDPCTLLTPGQAGGLDAQNITSANGPVNYCTWNQTGGRGAEWTAKLLTYQGAAEPARNAPHTAFGTLDGYGVTETADPELGPDITCRLSIDVADGQSLEIDYQSLRNDNPTGMSHQLACQRAYQLAGPVLGNLRVRR